MKPSIIRINVIPLYILINILMAQVTTALPFHLWDLSCEDGTLKLSLANNNNNNNAKITPNEITDSNNNKNVWEQLSQSIAVDDVADNDNENRLSENQAMLTTNDMLRQAAIAAAAENITKQVQAAGVTIKNGIRLPTLMQAGKFPLRAANDYETRQTRKIPILGTLDQAVNEYDDDDDEQPNENIDSFLAGIDDKYGTRDIVNEIVKRVLKETPTTKEEKEAAKASERFKTLQQESNRRNKNKNRHKKTKGEEESEVICSMKCKSKDYMEKPKSHETPGTATTLDQKPKQIECKNDKKNDEKSKDNEKELHKEQIHNKKIEGVTKKPKTKIPTKSNEFKWPCGDQAENVLCKMKCKTTHYDTLRNELMEDGATKRTKEKSKIKEDSDEKDKEHLIGSYNNYNDFEAPSQSQNVVKISTTTEEPNPTEEPNAEDAESTPEESVKNSTTEKPNSAEDQLETETTKDGKKPKQEKSEIEEYIDDGEQERKDLSAIDYSEQLENPIKVETALRRNIPNAEAFANFAKILNYENDDWYKKLMTDDKYTRLQNNLQLHPSTAFNTDKFKKSLSLNIGDGVKKPPKQYHTIKISGKLTEEDEDREEKEEKEKKQKEEEDKALKDMQLKEQLKVQVKDQQKEQLKEQLKVQQKVQLNDQQKEKIKDQQKEQEKPLKEKIDKEKEKELNEPKDKDQKEKVAKLHPKEKEEKEKVEKLLSETTIKPNKGEEDDDDSDYFTNWPIKTARIMLLKTINAEILELEGIRNRTLQEFENDKNETITTTTIMSTTPNPINNDTTTDACITTETITTTIATTTAIPTNTTESTSVSNTTTECVPDNDVTTTTTEEPTTNTTKTDTNCETTTKTDLSTFKSMALQSECATPTPKTPYSLLHKRRHGKSNRKIPMEVNDGILLLPFKNYYNTPIDSKAEFKREKPYRLLPRRPAPDNDEADEEFDEYDDDDEDEIDENTKWQTRREQQQDDYDTVSGNNYDETDEPEIKNSGKIERTSKITVMVGKNDKSDEICGDDEADDSEKKSKDEPKTSTTKSPNPPTSAGGGDEGDTKVKTEYNAKCEDTTTKKVEDSAGNLSQEIPAPCGDLNSKSSLENIIKVSSDIDLPNTKKLALQDLRGINSGGNAIVSTPHLDGVAPQREFSRERELFRIMSGLVGNHEKSSSKDSAGDAGTGREECKKTVKQPERRFFIF